MSRIRLFVFTGIGILLIVMGLALAINHSNPCPNHPAAGEGGLCRLS